MYFFTALTGNLNTILKHFIFFLMIHLSHLLILSLFSSFRLLFRLWMKSLEEWLLVLSYLELSCTQGIITE
jgi:hypothetical protein